MVAYDQWKWLWGLPCEQPERCSIALEFANVRGRSNILSYHLVRVDLANQLQSYYFNSGTGQYNGGTWTDAVRVVSLNDTHQVS